MDKIAENLDKRHQERKTRLNNLQDLKNREMPLNEGIEYFDSVFDEKIREIQNNLNNLESGDKNLVFTFSKVGQNLQDLQKFLSSSTFFLNDRKVQKCQETLNELIDHLEERRSQLVPKKKFGFKNRSKKILSLKNEKINEFDNCKAHTTFTYNASYRENTVIIFTPTESNEKDLTITNISNCVVRIEGHPGSLHLKNINNCIIVAGPVSRAVFVDNCHSCVLAIACQQFRLHNSKLCDIYLHVSSRGIIEDSYEIRVAPYNFKYPEIEDDYLATNLSIDKNNWNKLADFNWLSTEEKSPNWGVLTEEEKIQNWDKSIEDFQKKYVTKSNF